MALPVASFAPELLALYKKSAGEEIIIPLSSENACHTFRVRMHRLRVAMRKEQHFLLSYAEQVIILIREIEGKFFVICQPQDIDVKGILLEAGVTMEDLETLSVPTLLTDADEATMSPEQIDTLDLSGEDIVKGMFDDEPEEEEKGNE